MDETPKLVQSVRDAWTEHMTFDSRVGETNTRGDYGREAEIWLREKAAEADAVDRERFQTPWRWALIGGVAAVVAAIASLIAAWPVIKEWIR